MGSHRLLAHAGGWGGIKVGIKLRTNGSKIGSLSSNNKVETKQACMFLFIYSSVIWAYYAPCYIKFWVLMSYLLSWAKPIKAQGSRVSRNFITYSFFFSFFTPILWKNWKFGYWVYYSLWCRGFSTKSMNPLKIWHAICHIYW